MTRSPDIAPPVVTPHPLAPDSPIYQWPYRPVIALEQLPQAAYVWDDADPAVVWDGAPYQLVFPGVTGNYARVPDANNLDITGDIEIVVRVARQWSATPAVIQGWVAKWDGPTGATRSYLLRYTTSRRIDISWWEAGVQRGTTFTQPALTDGQLVWFRCRVDVNNGAGQYTITGDYSTANTATEPTTWTSLGAPVVGTTGPTSISVGTFPVVIGSDATASRATTGRIARAIVRNGIAGTTVLDIDEALIADYTSATFPARTGQTVTMVTTTGQTLLQSDTAYVWDAPFIGGGYTDASCDFHGVDIDPGDADDLYLFPATSCTVTLDNRSGAYTPWSPDGRLVYWAPGRRLHVFTIDGAGTKDWLFSGRVSSWQLNADDTVTVTAYDGFAWLAQELGGPWTPGVAGDTVAARLSAIMTAAGYPDRVDVEAGDVTLTAPTLDATTPPLEAAQRVALSDGGLFHGDADGSLDYRNRLWRTGRGDQPKVWAVSDNVCTAEVIVWDPELAADDERLATDIRLVNTANLTATAALTSSLWAGDARYRLAHPDPDQWSTQAQGDTLAAYLLAQQSTPAMALSRFALYVQDPHRPAAWTMAVRTRRGDRVEVLHEYPSVDGNPAILDTWAIVLGVAHQITPERWVADVALTRTVDSRVLELWDRTAFVWDQVDPANVWRY